VHDLWRVIADKTIGRESSEQITIFDSVGFALEDFSALTYVHRLAIELNEGVDIELVPTLDEPKNLFERVLNGRGRTQSRQAA
ncbi:MAG: ornithine cyclodeaminase, partial [Woeseiaceae bacterium]